MLCTLVQVKQRLEIATADIEYDSLITQIITGVSGRLAGACGRKFNGASTLKKASHVHTISVPDRRTEVIFLPAWPVIAITEIKEALYGGFAAAAALAENTDWQVIGETGELHRIGYWLQGINTVRVTYSAGYTSAGDTPGTGETALPADVTEAAIKQSCFEFQRRKEVGLTSMSDQPGSISMISNQPLLSDVAAVMKNYKRWLV